jgi:hypothetical protein
VSAAIGHPSQTRVRQDGDVLRQTHVLATLLGLEGKRPRDDVVAKLESARECMWPDCRRRPRDSHVISRTFLRFIAERDEVMGPRNPEISVGRKVGLVKPWPTKSPTTFHGYCDAHEKRFSAFDDDPPRRVAEAGHVRLQLCRTVACE